MLEILSALSDEELQIILPFLNHNVCLGILECVDHGMCNKTVPERVKEELRTKLVKHKKQFRYLINKEELRTSDRSACKEIIEKKKKVLASVADCLDDIFKVALPPLLEYIEKGGK